MKTTHGIIFSVVLGLICSGCGGQQTPSDFPKLYPLVIVVQNNGQAVAKVPITLVPEGASAGWGAAGETVASGEATIITSQGTYFAKGCPEGKFKVYLSEPPIVTGFEVSEEESRKMTQEESDAYAAKITAARNKQPKIIPAALGFSASEPFTIDVTKEAQKTVIELSKY